MNHYSLLSFYAVIEVTNCQSEKDLQSGKPYFRIFYSGGSCRSDIPVNENGKYRFKITPMAIDNTFRFRIVKKCKKIN